MKPWKLHLVVRSDLPPGSQAVQALHAMTEFMVSHPETAKAWHRDSNTIAFLEVQDEESLVRLAARATRLAAPVSPFREPDLGGSLTALAVGPGPAGRKACSGLPLALRGSSQA